MLDYHTSNGKTNSRIVSIINPYLETCAIVKLLFRRLYLLRFYTAPGKIQSFSLSKNLRLISVVIACCSPEIQPGDPANWCISRNDLGILVYGCY